MYIDIDRYIHVIDYIMLIRTYNIYIYIYGHRPPQALHFVGPKGDKHIYTYQCNMKWWKNYGKIHIKCMIPVPSSQSWVAIILDLFLFFCAEIRPKNGNKHTTIHLSTRILGFKSKKLSFEFLRIVQPKIQKSKNPSFQIESLDSGQKDGFLDFLGFFFWFFLDSSKGCLDFWVSKSKIQKNSRKKMDFCKKIKNPSKKMDSCKNPKKKPGKKLDFSNPDIKNPKKT